MTKYRVLDLFCGAGGLSLGFKLAGFQIVGGIDFQQDAIYTHKKILKIVYPYVEILKKYQMIRLKSCMKIRLI